MNREARELYRMQATVFKGMGHPIRIAILDFLRNGEQCVCDICDYVGSSPANVSKHLATMRHAGLITSRQDGTKIFYSLAMPCALGFFSCVNGVIKGRRKRQNKLLKNISG